MTRRDLAVGYAAIAADCVIAAACDAKHAPYLLNAIASLDQYFPDRPRIVVYDIGLSWLHRVELGRRTGVELRDVPPFVPHWRENWSWKLHVLTDVPGRYVLYLDLANFVILRSLAPWFLAIQKHGYFVVSNGQHLGQVAPADYHDRYGLRSAQAHAWRTFGAGIIGFDRQSASRLAIERALQGVVEGDNLGRSASEPSGKYTSNVIRDCACFRADQTVLNLAFREVYRDRLQVRRALRYGGKGGACDHPGQYLWYARRAAGCLTHLYRPDPRRGVAEGINRAHWFLKVGLIDGVKRLLASTTA
ncbi:MAG: hypothetical protein KBC73_16500 [Burkholderiaceae bacterium]|nr:hypothetical protein [Burkholderiaceae bacterium]